MNGIHEVEGSIPFGSTTYVTMHEKDGALFAGGHFFLFPGRMMRRAKPCRYLSRWTDTGDNREMVLKTGECC